MGISPDGRLQSSLCIRPVVYNLAQGVERRVSNLAARVACEELDGLQHPQRLAGAAGPLLAPVASEGVDGPSNDSGIIVVEALDDVGEALLISEVVEDGHTLAPSPTVGVTEAAPKGRQRGLPGQTEMPTGPGGTVLDAEMLDEGVEIVGSRVQGHHG